MKKYHPLVVILFLPLLLAAQKTDLLEQHYRNEWKTFNEMVHRSLTADPDTTIDVGFYHLTLDIAIESPWLQGQARILLKPASAVIDHFRLDLNRSLTVDSISGPVAGFEQVDDFVQIALAQNFGTGQTIDVTIHYHGRPQLAGGYKGMRYAVHNYTDPVVATLSTPYLAHYWYPCKDGPADKADSVYVDLIVPDTTITGIGLKGISNGVLEDVTVANGKKTFRWRHRYPIVTYYVMAAVSNYDMISEDYNGANGVTFPLQYYVFGESYNNALAGVEDMPLALDVFSELFGPYPFENEKYGMTELGFYGAIENQTNTIINSMGPSWFDTSVHELAHMWFGDMITCQNWHHGWLNEGFATYAEALYIEAQQGHQAYLQYMTYNQYYEGGTLYLQNAQDTFNIFQPIIYSKGAYVLHMLRGVMGDDAFFEGLKNYATDPALMYGHALTSDLQAVMEAAAGTDLGFFFDQWVYDEYYPVYRYNYQYDPFGGKTLVTVKQIQGETYGWRPLFEMPVPLRLHLGNGTDTLVKVWNNMPEQTFGFTTAESVTGVDFDPEGWLLDEAAYDPELPVGIPGDPPLSSLCVFPNPAGETIRISGLEHPASDQLELYDLSGALIRTLRPAATATFSLSGIPAGVYLLKWRAGGKNRTMPLVKR